MASSSVSKHRADGRLAFFHNGGLIQQKKAGLFFNHLHFLHNDVYLRYLFLMLNLCAGKQYLYLENGFGLFPANKFALLEHGKGKQ